MKQVIQSLKTGAIEVAEVPAPLANAGGLLIRTSKTLISAGTERMLLDFGRANWINKARQQPDKVRMVLDKLRTDGLAATVSSVTNKLGQPMPLGYCNVGIVMERGREVSGFEAGDRVVSNGRHAEIVAVPKNLCAKVPDSVADEDAVFTIAASIALQGVRLSKATLGECVAVMGLGLIGLLTVQLLRANGCRVIGFDFSDERLALARAFGAETCKLGEGSDPIAEGLAFSRDRGIDAALITASTDSDEPVAQSAKMLRKRGRIILVGVAGLELSRADFYEKELTFQVSCSYGPGRYDPEYEDKGRDYPVGFVRWTQQRNFEAVLDLMAAGALDLAPMRSHMFAITEAQQAYEVIGGAAPSLAVILDYPPRDGVVELTVEVRGTGDAQAGPRRGGRGAGRGVVNLIGAGSYASGVLAPAFAASGAELNAIASSGGLSATIVARKVRIPYASSDSAALIEDPSADTLIITTRHDSHADLIIAGLNAGKNIFVEKPLALNLDQVDRIEEAYAHAPGNPLLMVGFNRRFAPMIVSTKRLIDEIKGPKAFVYSANVGAIPADHWTQDREVGGGRIIGEACHFIDLLRFLAGSPIAAYRSTVMESTSADTATITLEFGDGTIGTIHYFANGSRRFPKERLEVFAQGRTLQMENFRRITPYDWPGAKGVRSMRQDKGQVDCARAFMEAVRLAAPSPIPIDEILEVARTTIAVVDPARR